MLPLYLYPLFPLIGFAVLILAGGRFKGTSAGWLGAGAVFASFGVAALNCPNLREAQHDVMWQWLPNMAEGGTNLAIGF